MCIVTTPMEDIEDAAAMNVDQAGNVQPSSTFAQPIATVPKCLYCGAPHPTQTTHFRFGDKMLCYLCGEVSSWLLVDQQNIRDDEYLDPVLYDKLPFLSPRDQQRKTESETENEHNENEHNETTKEATFNGSTDTIDFRVPVVLRPPNSGDPNNRERYLQQNASLATWQLPAMACPPVWWIIVDGTVGSTTSSMSGTAARNYWQTIGHTLTRALEEIPPHVHVGLLTATGSKLASWDLTSAVPHVQQYPYSYDPAAIDAVEGGGEGQTTISAGRGEAAWDFCLVPANGHYKANLEAAIRAMVDGAMSGLFWEESSSDNTNNNNGEEKKMDHRQTATTRTSQYVPLGLTLEILLEFMEQAVHPGQEEEDDGNDDGEGDADSNDNDNDTNGNGMTKLRYAGGKILCLLGNPTLETGKPPTNDSLSYIGQPSFGLGGVAGSCRSEDEDDSSKNTNKDGDAMKTDPTDLTASNLEEYAMPLEPDQLLVNIGSRCAKAALGVDLIVLVPEEDDDDANTTRGDLQSSRTIPWYGLPLLRPLSDCSGAPGPLMFGTGNIGSVEERDDESKENKYTQKFERLHENVLARTPWQAGMVFGAQMKLRLSPGLRVEITNVDEKASERNIHLASFLLSGGIMGPAVAVSNDEKEGGEGGGDIDENDKDYSWIMGSCDPHTSFTIDLETDGEGLPDECDVEGFGSIALKPVLQTCTLFTCIEKDGAQPTPNYFTVCKIRVSSVALDFADYTESVLNGLDLEALSVVIFNKIVYDSYLTGFVAAQAATERWLIAAMASIYESAKVEQAELKNPDCKNDFDFLAGDRLLDTEGGSLEETDILLGKGHFKARNLPFLTYAILQSDAVKPSGRDFKPSMDARLCAIAQMASMTPKAMAKTIAPPLSLWSIYDNDAAIAKSLPLGKESILEALNDLGEEKTGNAIFLLDSTKNAIFFTANDMKEFGKDETREQRFSLGADFESAIAEVLTGYRTPPPQFKAFVDLLDSDGQGHLDDFKVPPSVLRSMLVEDMSTFGGDKNFEEWKSRMAESIKEAVKEEGNETKGGLSRFFFGA